MKSTIPLLLAILILCSCNRKITGTWKNPQQLFTYDTIMVTALTINLHAKRIIEHNIAGELTEKGVQASKSCEVFPPNFTDETIGRDHVFERIHRRDANAILVLSLFDMQTENHRHKKGTHPYKVNDPDRSAVNSKTFWNYFTHWYPRVYTPRYYIPGKTYFIEANLYDAYTEELIWSARSKEYRPVDLARFSRVFAALVANKLEKDEVIVTKNKDREPVFIRLAARSSDRPHR